MKMSTYSATMDWLSVTFAWDTLRKDYWALQADALQEASFTFGLPNKWELVTPMHGYRRCIRNTVVTGATVMMSDIDSPMGVHLQLAGSALRVLDLDWVIATVVARHGKPSRCDLAIDVFGETSIDDLETAFTRGECVTRGKQYAMITSQTGQTFYLGSRSSDRYLRVYDKAGESGVDGDWTRIEIECKRDRAQEAFNAWRAFGGDAPRGVIRAFADFPTVRWWVDALAGQIEAIGTPKNEKRRNTRAWIEKAVIPALARECVIEPELLNWVVMEVRKKLSQNPPLV